MKTIDLNQIKPDEVEVLQNELEQYSNIEKLGLHHWGTNDFLNALLTVEISLKLWFMLRSRLESKSKTYNLKLRISEAVIILKCCQWPRSLRNDYERNVTEKFKGLLAEQLMNIL